MISSNPSFDLFRLELVKAQGLDISAYKESQLLRRLNSYMHRHHIADFRELAAYIHSPQQASQLIDYLDINVSEFFRNPELFEYLEQIVFPSLTVNQQTVRVWSAGCSIGAEPYSVAISALSSKPPTPVTILATDLDAGALAQAASGQYTLKDISNVGQERRLRYFDVSSTVASVKRDVKGLVKFQRHDLLKDPIEGEFDLIICRNVAIYFTEEAKQLMLRRFASVLAYGGYLFTGATESYHNHRDFGLKRIQPCFYQKVGE